MIQTGTLIVHRFHPWHGVGRVVDVHGRTIVAVQWPGLTMTRREHIDSVEPYVEPAPPERSRKVRSR